MMPTNPIFWDLWTEGLLSEDTQQWLGEQLLRRDLDRLDQLQGEFSAD